MVERSGGGPLSLQKVSNLAHHPGVFSMEFITLWPLLTPAFFPALAALVGIGIAARRLRGQSGVIWVAVTLLAVVVACLVAGSSAAAESREAAQRWRELTWKDPFGLQDHQQRFATYKRYEAS